MMKISSLKLEGGALYACIETLQWGGATLGPGKDCWRHLQPSQLLHLAQLHSLHSFTACSASTYRVFFSLVPPLKSSKYTKVNLG